MELITLRVVAFHFSAFFNNSFCTVLHYSFSIYMELARNESSEHTYGKVQGSDSKNASRARATK